MTRVIALVVCSLLSAGCYTIKPQDRQDFSRIKSNVSDGTPARSVFAVVDASRRTPNDNQNVAETKRRIAQRLNELDSEIVVERKYRDDELLPVMNKFKPVGEHSAAFITLAAEDTQTYALTPADLLFLRQIVLSEIGESTANMTGRMQKHLDNVAFWKEFGKLLLKAIVRYALASGGRLDIRDAAPPNQQQLSPYYDEAVRQLQGSLEKEGAGILSAEGARAQLNQIRTWLTFLSRTLRTIANDDPNGVAQTKQNLRNALQAAARRDDPDDQKRLTVIIDTATDLVFLLITKVKLEPSLKEGFVKVADLIDEILADTP
jgi:hypothetical protein